MSELSAPSAPRVHKDLLWGGISGLFGAFAGIAVALALALLIFPSPEYLAMSYYLQLVTAFAGAGAICLLYFRYGRNTGMLYGAGAFALWGLSNVAWYFTGLDGGKAWVFPSLIDMGIVASIIILTSAYGRLYPRMPFSGQVILGILVFSLVVPLAIIFSTGASGPALMTLLYFFACGTLVITALNHGVIRRPAALVGTLLFAIAFMAYPVREMFFSANQYLTILGLFVAAGFSLIVIGFLPGNPAVSEPAEKTA
ncbi:MAG: hypothetical protein WC342_02605 [Methanoregula sp.]|jgi:hypothetical protein